MIRVWWHKWRATRLKKRIGILQFFYELHVDELYILASRLDQKVSDKAKTAIEKLDEKPEYWDGNI